MAATRQVERNFGIAVLNPSFWEDFGNLVSFVRLIFLGVWPRILNLNVCAVAVRIQEKMAELTTNEKVAVAFKMAGYTCRSFHGARNSAGTPFSKATSNDDCAPWTAGTPASSINCNANSYGHHAPLCACKSAKQVTEQAVVGTWFKGQNGQVCNSVCKGNGFSTCDAEKMAELTTNEKVAVAFKMAGYTCRSFHGARNYAGTPFSKATSNHDCAPWTAGTPASSINCNANSYGHHAPLCACKSAKQVTEQAVVGTWFKGQNGQVCNSVCKSNGFSTCDAEKMAELTTNEKVAVAFKMAGYTCRSFHGAHNYAGTPFSKATSNDDCAPWTAGTPASSINCNANSYGHHAPLCACKSAKQVTEQAVLGTWFKGQNGQVCNSVCKSNGFSTCDAEKMAELTTNEKVAVAFKMAGYTCRSFHGARNYAGTPFSKATSNDDCAPWTAGTPASSINCNANSYGHHAPLCACKSAKQVTEQAVVGTWFKGQNGQVCNSVCKSNGFSTCDAEKMAELTTNEKVAVAFKMAGYTCRSFHGARNYAGTPFSKATSNDDCAPWTAGTPASSINCNANSYGHHVPLCACK